MLKQHRRLVLPMLPTCSVRRDVQADVTGATHHDSVKAVLAQRRHVLELGVSRADGLVDRDLGALPRAMEEVLRQVQGEGYLGRNQPSSGGVLSRMGGFCHAGRERGNCKKKKCIQRYYTSLSFLVACKLNSYNISE